MSVTEYVARKGTRRADWTLPHAYRLMQLDVSTLRRSLTSDTGAEAARKGAAVMSLPLPNGKMERFQFTEVETMEAGLASRYPGIKTYQGHSLADPTVTVALDLSNIGFHALILDQGRPVSIHPVENGDTLNYISYFGREHRQMGTHECFATTGRRTFKANQGGARAEIGPTLRTYRVAIATTQGYSDEFGKGKAEDVLASVVSWLNQTNAAFQKELSVRMVLVNNNDKVIFTDDKSPLTGAKNADLLGQVTQVLRDQIGPDNYDVGHVLAVGGASGVAFITSVCVNEENAQGAGPLKGGGVTTVNKAPVGDIESLGTLIHEFGHQFGANHTYNDSGSGSCTTRNAATAYEPGSGLTLMSYVGICGDGNNTAGIPDIQLRFHAGSFEEIVQYLAQGATCAQTTETGNKTPTVEGGGNFTIPRNTPFVLTAKGADPGNNALTYAWEQVDAGGEKFPSPPFTDKDDGEGSTRPIFNAIAPTTAPSRTFPSLAVILNNANVSPDKNGEFATADSLPNVSRQLNFRVTVRNNLEQGGGASNALVTLTVDGSAGPFAVTAPNGGETWGAGSEQTVTWDVAQTDGGNVKCANVRISLSTDGGQTFSVLAESVPNNGSAKVTLPREAASTQARIRVEAIDNVFFDIADKDFTIGAASNRTVVPFKKGFAVGSLVSAKAVSTVHQQ